MHVKGLASIVRMGRCHSHGAHLQKTPVLGHGPILRHGREVCGGSEKFATKLPVARQASGSGRAITVGTPQEQEGVALLLYQRRLLFISFQVGLRVVRRKRFYGFFKFCEQGRFGSLGRDGSILLLQSYRGAAAVEILSELSVLLGGQSLHLCLRLLGGEGRTGCRKRHAVGASLLTCFFFVFAYYSSRVMVNLNCEGISPRGGDGWCGRVVT